MSNCCINKSNAVITAVLGVGSVASPYYIQVNITDRLCYKACADQTPIFAPTISLVSYASVGTNQYVATIHCDGVISYLPCDADACCAKMQLISQDFTLPFSSATAPTSVTIAQGTAVSVISAPPCRDCGRTFVCEIPVTLTIA